MVSPPPAAPAHGRTMPPRKLKDVGDRDRDGKDGSTAGSNLALAKMSGMKATGVGTWSHTAAGGRFGELGGNAQQSAAGATPALLLAGAVLRCSALRALCWGFDSLLDMTSPAPLPWAASAWIAIDTAAWAHQAHSPWRWRVCSRSRNSDLMCAAERRRLSHLRPLEDRHRGCVHCMSRHPPRHPQHCPAPRPASSPVTVRLSDSPDECPHIAAPFFDHTPPSPRSYIRAPGLPSPGLPTPESAQPPDGWETELGREQMQRY